MMLRVDEVHTGPAVTHEKGATVEEPLASLLAIEGLRSVFRSRDFITITRSGNADWQPILAAVGRVMGEGGAGVAAVPSEGRVEVHVQEYRGIPVQVRATGAEGQARVALPERFSEALKRTLVATGGDYLAERRWRAADIRFGNAVEVAQMIAEEIGAMEESELADIEAAAAGLVAPRVVRRDAQAADLSNPDPAYRLRAVRDLALDGSTFPIFAAALADEQASVRRWAAARLGVSALPDAVEPLCHSVTNDPSIGVRRTAGDALSDLGDPRAIPAMCQALRDPAKLVRWRAARFLSEVGDASSVPALREAEAAEREFEVKMEMNAARARIEGGGPAKSPMWLRIARGGG